MNILLAAILVLSSPAATLDAIRDALAQENAAVADSLALVALSEADTTSRRVLEEMLERLERAAAPDTSSMVRVRARLVGSFFETGDFTTAREHQEWIVRWRRAGVNSTATEVLDDLYNLGYLCFLLEDLPAARDVWTEYLDELERAGNGGPEALAQARSDLAEIHRRLGDYERAEQLLRDALAAAGTTPSAIHAVVLNNLGALCWDQGRYDECEAFYLEALRLSEADTVATPLRLAHAHENLGVLYRDQGKLAPALEHLERAVAMARAEADSTDPVLVTFLDGLAGVHSRQGDHERAAALWMEGLRILEQSSVSSEIYKAVLLRHLGRAQLALEHPQEARETFTRALAVREGVLGTKHAEVGGSAIDLAVALTREDGLQSAPARALLDRGISLLGGAAVSRETLAEGLALRAAMRRASGESDAARADLEAAIAIVEDLRPRRGAGDETRAEFLRDFVEYYSTMVAWLVDEDRIEEALLYSERARARVLWDQLVAGRVDVMHDLPPDRRKELEKRETDARIRIAHAERTLASAGAATDKNALDRLEKDLANALNDYRDVISEARLLNPTWRELLRTGAPDLSLEDVRARLLAPGGILLLYQVGTERSFVFLVGDDVLLCRELHLPEGSPLPAGLVPGPLGDRALAQLLLGGATNLKTFVEQLRGKRIDSGFAVTAPERFHLLWTSLLPEEIWDRVRTATEALVIPDAGLHLLPFEALVTSSSGDSSQYWLDDGPPVRYGNGLSALLYQTQHAPREHGTVVSVSDPVFGSATGGGAKQLPQLPGTRAEALAISDAFAPEPVHVFLGAQATESSLRQFAPHTRYLHLATHGLVDEGGDHLLASLALSAPAAGEADDGFLHLFEIYDLDLDCELAVLSACETSVANPVRGEGVFAICRGFQTAGARRTVASLWAVADESTAALMSHFFTGVATAEKQSAGIPYASILRDAKRSLREDPRWRSPFYWAPFVLTGIP